MFLQNIFGTRNSYFRVSIIPAVAQTLVKKGFTVAVEENAGKEAKFTNADYEKAGAKLVDRANVYKSGKKVDLQLFYHFNLLLVDIILKVRQPVEKEVDFFKDNSTLISFIYPVQNKSIVDQLAKKKMTVFGENGIFWQQPMYFILHF